MPPPNPRVLIVDEDEPLRRMYRRALTVAGFQVVEAEDGLAALQSLDRDPPDIVVLDLDLPYFSGTAVSQEIGAHTRDIPVVVVTGSLESVEGVDAECVLRKPIDPEHLVSVVRACLASGSGDSVP